MSSYRENLRVIHKHYGASNQFEKLIEELAELIVAISKKDVKSIKEEMADCQVLMDQIMMAYNCEPEVCEIRHMKAEREVMRIAERCRK